MIKQMQGNGEKMEVKNVISLANTSSYQTDIEFNQL